jgi:tRNA modification GTPase
MISSEAFFETSVFSVFDTAGVRETDDVIEEKGIEMSLGQLGDADVVIGVFEKYDEKLLMSLKKDVPMILFLLFKIKLMLMRLIISCLIFVFLQKQDWVFLI